MNTNTNEEIENQNNEEEYDDENSEDDQDAIDALGKPSFLNKLLCCLCLYPSKLTYRKKKREIMNKLKKNKENKLKEIKEQKIAEEKKKEKETR